MRFDHKKVPIVTVSLCTARIAHHSSLPLPLQTSCDVAEYNLLQFLRLAFPGSITADVLRTPSSNNGHADKTSSKLAVVEEVVEDESGEGNGEEEKKHESRGEDKDGATKGMVDGRPLVPG